jgi:hypothetical protein
LPSDVTRPQFRSTLKAGVDERLEGRGRREIELADPFRAKPSRNVPAPNDAGFRAMT